ncbi:MAG TPA: heavy-metal-associated domain-containing protein [Firmicutes bacterium]|nr:heavy-metal-associated domain-containing protein [Bacillota bacterium]
MKKVVEIKGMSCEHCQNRVEKALNALPGIRAEVNHKKGQAVLSVDGEWNEEAVIQAVSNAGYEVVSITDKKGLFGRR